MAEEERPGEVVSEEGVADREALKKQRRRRLGIIGVVVLGVLFGLVIVLAQCGGGGGDDVPVVGDGEVVGLAFTEEGTVEPTATMAAEPTATAEMPTPTAGVEVEVLILPTYTPYPTYTPGVEYPTPEPWPTYTMYPTGTPYPTATPWPAPTPYPTHTPYPVPTPYPTLAALPTHTPYPTLAEPTPYPTATPRPTYTPYPTATPYPDDPSFTLEPAQGKPGDLITIKWRFLPRGAEFQGGSAKLNGQPFNGGLGNDGCSWGGRCGSSGFFLVPSMPDGKYLVWIMLVVKGANNNIEAQAPFTITGGS